MLYCALICVYKWQTTLFLSFEFEFEILFQLGKLLGKALYPCSECYSYIQSSYFPCLAWRFEQGWLGTSDKRLWYEGPSHRQWPLRSSGLQPHVCHKHWSRWEHPQVRWLAHGGSSVCACVQACVCVCGNIHSVHTDKYTHFHVCHSKCYWVWCTEDMPYKCTYMYFTDKWSLVSAVRLYEECIISNTLLTASSTSKCGLAVWWIYTIYDLVVQYMYL